MNIKVIAAAAAFTMSATAFPASAANILNAETPPIGAFQYYGQETPQDMPAGGARAELEAQTPTWDAPADIQNNPYIHYIYTLLGHGVAKCRTPGRFRPDAELTFKEAAELLMGVIDLRNAGYVTGGDSLGRAAALGYIPADWTGRGQLSITRGQLADMLYNYMASLPEFDNSTYYLPDAGNDPAPGYLRAKGVMYPCGDGYFHPETPVSRGESCYSFFTISGLELAYGPDNLPQSIQIYTPYVSQLNPVYAVVGCEGASLLMGLKAKGYCGNVGLKEFLDNMPKHSSNPAKGFVGSPYKAGQNGLRTTIYPAPLAQYASRYGRVIDISGSSPREIQAEVLSGNPVVIYATLYWNNPRYQSYNIEGQTQTLLRNNHAVLVNGYDRSTGRYHIADPYNVNDTSEEYTYWIDGATLESIYNIRRFAVVVI